MTTAQYVGLLVTLILGFIGSALTIIITIISYLTGRMDRGFDAINTRFNDMRDLWRAELHRVEEILDVRLKHLEGH